MDNIQKLILGVLSVAGMIAMLVPSSDPVAPPAANSAAAVATIIETPAPADVAAEEQLQEEADLNEEDVFLIGEPAIDGNPIQPSFENNNDSPPPAVEQFSAPSVSDYGQTGSSGGQAVVTGQSFAQPLTPPPAN
jgi:hypothetical protein